MADSKRNNLVSFLDFSHGQMHQSHRPFQTLEIVLQPEVLTAICRRGRRRLRDIQQSCQASLKLDRYRGVLLVTGSKDSIKMVQKQLETVSGPSLTVSPPVWAELMRTRTNTDPTQAAVARIQQESGCRIHIERNVQQVRLFGGKSEVAVGLRIFEEFERLCTEVAVSMECPSQVDVQILQRLAQDTGVTLKVEDDSIMVLGIAGAVEEAAKQLRNFDGDGQMRSLSEGTDPEQARIAISTAMAKLAVADNMSSAPTTADSLPPLPLTSCNSDEAASFTSNESFSFCPTCGSSGCFCIHCGKNVVEHRLAGCPTCGVAKFCVYCGQPTERMLKMGSVSPSSPKPILQNKANMYMPNVGYGDVPQMQSMQMMQMPMMQMPVQTATTPSQSQGSPVMMPEGMMIPMPMSMPVDVCYQQGMTTANPANGMQSMPVMMPPSTPGNAGMMMPTSTPGMQVYMMPTTSASFE